MSVTKKITKKISNIKEGVLFRNKELGILPNEYIAAAKALERLIAKKEIKRLSKGIYYKPLQTEFGELQPREQELIRPYLFSKNKRVAYITGLSLYNKLGLTTQVPKTITVTGKANRPPINIGTIQVRVVKGYVKVTNDNYNILELLDVLKDLKKIPDLDKTRAIKFLLNAVRNFNKKDLSKMVKYAVQYPARTRALLGAILNEVDLSNNTAILEKNLNPLTSYKLGINKDLLSTAPHWNIK